MSADAAPLAKVGGYVIGERLGAGGFGEVYRARHPVLGKSVAIKLLHARFSDDADAVGRFIAEARAVSKISHPGIVEIFDFGVLDDGRQYFVMELIDGQTLRDVLRARGRLPLPEATPILRAIATAIDAAHGAGVAHRDLKPDNVFVLPDGRVKLIDFGLAKLSQDAGGATPVTQTGAMLGTPLYMSPEQCRGKDVDARTDAYSFGVMAYEVLTGGVPFTGEALAVALEHLHTAPEPPSRREPALDARVDRVVLAWLAKDPAARPRPLATAVDAIAGDGALPSPPRRPMDRRRVAFAAAALALTGAGAAIVILTRGDAPPPPASAAPQTRALDLRGDGLAANVALAADGRTLRYADRGGWWRRALDGGGDATRFAPVPLGGKVREVHELPGGRWVVEIGTRNGARLARVGPDGELHVLLGGLELDVPFAVDAAGTRVAYVLDRHLFVTDITAGATEASDLGPVGVHTESAGWSPDGTRLVIADRDGVEIVAADGSGRTPVPIAPALDGGTDRAVVWAGDSELAYCTPSGEVRVRAVRSPDEGAELVIAHLPRPPSTCELSATRDGQHVAVVARQAKALIGWIDLAEHDNDVHVLDTTADARFFAAVAPERTAVYALDQTGDMLSATPASRTLYRIDVAQPSSTVEPSCPGDSTVVRRGAAIVHVALELRDGTPWLTLRAHRGCDAIDAWKLPVAGAWTSPRCTATWCVLGLELPDELQLWRLDAGGALREIGHAAPATTRPTFAISRDEQQIAFVARVGTLGVLPASGGAIVEQAQRAQVQSVVWAPGDEPLFTTRGSAEGGEWTLQHLRGAGADAEPPIWRSRLRWLGTPELSDDGTRVYGRVRDYAQDVVVIDR